jgi:hypothetical protein
MEMVTAVARNFACCRGPSAPWPTFAQRERKKNSATPVGMTCCGPCERIVESEGVGGDFGVVGGPVVGGKGDAPEFGGRLEEFDADFGFALGGGSDVDYADELFFEGISVADKNFLTEFDAHGREDQGAVEVDVGGESVFGDVLLVGAAGDDENGEAKKDALGAAAIGRRGVVGGGMGHGEDGRGIVLKKKRKRSRGGKYSCTRGKGMVPEEGVEPTRGVIPGRF